MEVGLLGGEWSEVTWLSLFPLSSAFVSFFLDGESVILLWIICLFVCVRVSGWWGGCVLVYRTLGGGEDWYFTGDWGCVYAGVVYLLVFVVS